MEGVNSQILQKGFGLKLYSSTRTRTGLVCKTDCGTKELKKVYGDKNSIAFEDTVKRYLKERGFLGVNLYYKTLDGGLFYLFDDCKYVLEDYTQSQCADLSDRETLKKSVYTLARLHTSSLGVKSESPIINSGRLCDIYKKRELELWRIMKKIKSSRTITKRDRLVLEYGPRYIERAKLAYSILEASNYEEVSKLAVLNSSVCHNTYKGENIRVSDFNKSIIVTGFNKCAIDIPCVDLAEFISRGYRKNSISPKDTMEIIEFYNEARPLKNDELNILYGILTFPNKFFKLINTHYNKRRSFISEATTEKFETYCNILDSENKFLLELKDLLKIN